MRSSATEPDRDELARLLKEAGSTCDPDGVEALIEGVLAAPAEVVTRWHILVADPMTPELARRLEGTGVTSYALHPGVIASDIWRRVPWPVRPLMTRRMQTPEQGARTSV